MGDTRDVAGGRQTTSDLESCRKAFADRAWATARDHFGRADPGTLTPVDWHSLATAAYLVADRDSAIRAWQQAFSLHSTAGERVAAAMDAQWIAYVHNTSGNVAVGGGWVARGLRLLEGEPEDAEARGFFLMHQFYRHLGAGDIASAADCGRQVLAIGQRWGNGDLTAFGLVSQGRMLIYSGQVPEGLTLLDEAMVGLAAGEVSPIGSGNIYCAMIEGCQEISDYRRMTQWTEALNRWCEAQPDLVPFTGQCAVHRGQVLRAQGAFREALDELDLRRPGRRRREALLDDLEHLFQADAARRRRRGQGRSRAPRTTRRPGLRRDRPPPRTTGRTRVNGTRPHTPPGGCRS